MTETTDASRVAEHERTTSETDVTVEINLDGGGDADIQTELPVFDHLLNAFAYHGRFDLHVDVDGDLETGSHHTIEDTAIALGTAIHEAVDSGHGIERFADCRIPLDDAVADIVLDVSGRPYFEFTGSFSHARVNDVPSDMMRHFFQTLAMTAEVTLHASITGRNTHHEAEALFKAVGRSFDEATRRADTRGEPPSTKGTL